MTVTVPVAVSVPSLTVYVKLPVVVSDAVVGVRNLALVFRHRDRAVDPSTHSRDAECAALRVAVVGEQCCD